MAQQPTGLKRYLSNFNSHSDNQSKPQLLFYPTLGFAPETKLELGISALYLRYGNRDTSNRLSEIMLRSFYTLENQYGFFLENAYYLQNDKLFILGTMSYDFFPMAYYGIGIESSEADKQIVSSKQFLAKERVLFEWMPNFYMGPQFEYNNTSKISFEEASFLQGDQQIFGSRNFQTLSLGFGAIIDNRRNVLNVRDGYFVELAHLRSNSALLSDYNFNTTIADIRYFFSPVNNQVFASQFYSQFTQGEVPFNQLAQLGGPYLMRGYYQGRFRDNNLAALQLEYRFLPLPFASTTRIGATIFGTAATVFDQFDQQHWEQARFAGGIGLRYLVFPQKDVFIRADVAFTREGSALYIFIGEAF